MKLVRKMVSFAFAVTLGAVSAPAAGEISKLYTDWAAGPVSYLFTDADREAWAKVGDDGAAETFVRLFWLRRDPTANTPDNEFRRDFERRVALANQTFGTEKDGVVTPGWKTDRGRVAILLGPPHRRQKAGSEGIQEGGDFGVGESDASSQGTVASGGGPGKFGRGGSQERFGAASEEQWLYEKEHKPAWIQKKRLTLRFRTTPGTEAVELHEPEEALALLAEAVRRAVVMPDLGETDVALLAGAAGVSGHPSMFGADPLADAATLGALREAVAGAAAPRLVAHLDAGVFQANDGTWIVPVQVSTPVPPPSGATAFGELVDGAGASLLAFTVERAWRAGTGQTLAQATLVPPAGRFELRAGVRGADGQLLWSGREEIVVPGEASELWLSEILLAENIAPMQQAQDPLEPFAWQGIAVEPKGDRAFAHGSVLWVYLHACQPPLDAAGKPALSTTIELSGAARMRGALRGEPVKAGDRCWVLAQALELAATSFPAGDYNVRVLVTDPESGRALTAEAPFKVVAGAG